MIYKTWPGDKVVGVETCDNQSANMCEAIGGKWHRFTQMYRLSPRQFRDMELLVKSGLVAFYPHGDYYPVAKGEFYHPATDVIETRADAIKALAPRPRCTRTMELAL